MRGVLAAGEPLDGRAVAVLGTGGAGRSVARATTDAGADVTLVSRFPSRVPTGCRSSAHRLEALADGPAFDVVVNATPIGRGSARWTATLPYERCCSGALAVDLNYTPPVTSFLRAARPPAPAR